ncbi:MAG: hypothetical protein JWO38_3559 [Gemmataceae bacterium]|nr:hypothetical protein [Gemmataceae bacterium]
MPTMREQIETSAATNPAPPTGTEEVRLPLTPESAEYLADCAWVNGEYNSGRWEPHVGSYIAVVGKQLLGHGPDPLRLREEVARDHGVRPGRIVITYIERPIEC